MKRNALLASALLLGAAASSCCSGGGGLLVPESPAGNVTLCVGNQSDDVDPVDVEIRLDGEPILRASYCRRSQHTEFATYRLAIEPRTHSLRIEADEGRATLERSISVTGEHWALVEFLADPRRHPPEEVRASFQDEPFHFR